MALKPCQGCGRQVDETAAACPGCGRPKPTTAPPPTLPPGTRWGYAISTVIVFSLIALCVAKSGDPEPSWKRAGLSGPIPAEQAKTMTVSQILALGQGNDGKEICMCGFVEGTTSASTNTIYVTERRAKNRKEHPVGVMCVWDNDGAKNSFSLPYGSAVCVRGTFLSAFLKPCSTVDNCPL